MGLPLIIAPVDGSYVASIMSRTVSGMPQIPEVVSLWTSQLNFTSKY